jgi:hypothetical protein
MTRHGRQTSVCYRRITARFTGDSAAKQSYARVRQRRGTVPQALAHFLVGLAGGVLVITWLDPPTRVHLPTVVLSGVWALLPDGHRFFRMAGLPGISGPWQTVHRSSVSNVFWLHHVLDEAETGLKEFEIAAALGVTLLALGVNYLFGDRPE